jgi:4-hydroxyacetophenone monooxygenase
LFGAPTVPDIAGAEGFGGRVMHSAQWDPSYDLRGKRVAVIGTGSSGVQLLGPVAGIAEHVTVFQRSAPWIADVPIYTDEISEEIRWLFANVPYYQQWIRLGAVYGIGDTRSADLDVDPLWTDPATMNAGNHRLRENLLAYRNRKIGHRADLMAKVDPPYSPMARRLPKDNGWFDAILESHVELDTTAIDRITEQGIRTVDGREIPFDLIVLATGFNATDFLLSIDVEGRNTSLRDFWTDGARAYLGITVPHMPNLFCMYGPNTNGRAVGPFAWGEMQMRYTLKCIRHLIRSGKHAIEVREEPYADYNRRLDERLANMIWTHEGVRTYFWNEHGRIATNGGFFNAEYSQWTYEPDLADFLVS